MRSTSLVTLVAFIALTLQPLAAVAQTSAAAEPVKPRGLEVAENAVKRVVPRAWPRLSGLPDATPASDEALAATAQTVLIAEDAIESETDAVLAELAATRERLLAKGMSPEILARHDQAVADIESRRAQFRTLMQSVDTAVGGKQNFLSSTLGLTPVADDPAALRLAVEALADFMAKHPNKRRHTPSDPAKLPWGTPEGEIRPPIDTDLGYQLKGLFPQQSIKLAAAGSIGGIVLPPSAGAAPTDDDLGESDEIQLTAEIRDQAQALGNNAVAIHNWVRNNIAFVPSYGSIQGAALTMSTRRGNAFDTASLEIALLRAAGIPARYAYGTIEAPIEQVKNWVGGVTTPQAALSLLAKGGIPSIALIAGGGISAVQLEHVWVEAWVDYIPSRGAKQVNGDTWVPLDASFKQYQFTSGMDLPTQVPFDAQAILDQATSTATVNETEGWVQNLDQASLQTALSQYQTSVQSYLEQNAPEATVGDVLGTQAIVLEEHRILLGTLPYKTVANGARFATMPANLQWKYRTALYTGEADYFGDPTGSQLAALSGSTARLAGRKITISFIPATQDDEDLINSYLPAPHPDGTPIDPSELPSSLPGYLINLKAEIGVDGEIVSQSTVASTMGQTLTQITAMFNPGTQSWEQGDANQPIAGEYHAIALDLQGVGQTQLSALKARLEATQAKLQQFQQNPDDPTPVQDLGKEDLSGDLLYSGILGYFASVDGSDQLTARTRGDIVSYRFPSYGAFFAAAQPHYWFGIARSVSFPGVTMDVDRLMYQLTAKDNDPVKHRSYMRQVGAAGSAFEHAVPERLFIDTSTCNAPGTTTPDPTLPACAQGISAVKAIAIAAAQGQKIYTLNAANQAYHQQMLAEMTLDADTKWEIANALAAGKEVTTHQAEISVDGWTGAGYIILNPDSGAGAYKISGGANGGNLGLAATAAAHLALLSMLAGNLASAGLIATFGIAASYYALVLAGLVVTFVVIEVMSGGVPSCGVQPSCSQLDWISNMVAIGSFAALIGAGAAGGLVPLVYAILLARNILSGR